MNIDIDIRVSGDDGEKLQTVSRHFSGDFSKDLDWSEGVDKLGRSFDSFLAEFLTSSGRIFRHALLYGNRMAGGTKIKKEKEKNEESEVSYRIQFGNGQKAEGRIPIFKTLSEMTGKGKKRQKTKEKLKTKKVEYENEQPEDFIYYFMQKAVERYESNFIHAGETFEESNCSEWLKES